MQADLFGPVLALPDGFLYRPDCLDAAQERAELRHSVALRTAGH